MKLPCFVTIGLDYYKLDDIMLFPCRLQAHRIVQPGTPF